MNVRFINSHTGIVYKVLDDKVMEFDEDSKQYCKHYKIEIMGDVPERYLEETDEESNAIEVAINLTNKVYE